MKKAFCVLLILILTLSFANAEDKSEILFQGVEWLSNDTVTFQRLKEAEFLCGDFTASYTNERGIFITSDSTDLFWPTMESKYGDVFRSVRTSEYAKGRMAGFPVKELNFTFAYDGDYRLITVEVSLLGADYETIKMKLDKAYGEGKTVESELDEESTIWKGGDNTAILLYTQNEGYDYQLIYGRLDAEEILINCLATPDSDDISGL